jgi:2-pyrone-4,6-dicarboxylate lactonase
MSESEVRRDGPEWVTKKPRYAMPPLACDAHVHIYGPAGKFPFSPAHLHLAFDAPKEALRTMHDAIGVQRCVIVHAATHGTDLSVILDALAGDESRYRAVAIVEDAVTDARLEELHTAGVRAIRYNFVPHLGGPPDLDDFARMAARIAPLGWHVALHMKAEDILSYAGVLRKLPLPVLFDHMARIDPSLGEGQPPLQCLLDFLAEGHWVKIAALEKLSKQRYPFADSVAIGAALVKAAPDRVIWGTDWPHPLVGTKRTNDGDLVDLIPALAGEPSQQYKLLVENPARLYQFT